MLQYLKRIHVVYCQSFHIWSDIGDLPVRATYTSRLRYINHTPMADTEGEPLFRNLNHLKLTHNLSFKLKIIGC